MLVSSPTTFPAFFPEASEAICVWLSSDLVKSKKAATDMRFLNTSNRKERSYKFLLMMSASSFSFSLIQLGAGGTTFQLSPFFIMSKEVWMSPSCIRVM
jgi:hypothetical protein